MDTLELKLERLRKLYKFAKSKGNEKWAAQIAKDGKRLKEESNKETKTNYEVMKELVELHN